MGTLSAFSNLLPFTADGLLYEVTDLRDVIIVCARLIYARSLKQFS